MKEAIVFIIGGLFGAIIISQIFMVTESNAPYIRAYKQGQIDAINGQIKYRLEKNSDGTTEWKEIKK